MLGRPDMEYWEDNCEHLVPVLKIRSEDSFSEQSEMSADSIRREIHTNVRCMEDILLSTLRLCFRYV